MYNFIPMTGYFDLSCLKGNGKLYEAEITKIRGLYAVLCTQKNSDTMRRIRCCDRGVYPKTALSHMGFRLIAKEEVDNDGEIIKEEKDNFDEVVTVISEDNEVAEKEVIEDNEVTVKEVIENEVQTTVADCVINKHNIYMLSVGNNKLFYSFAKAGEDKNDDAYLCPSLFPGIKVIQLNIGVKYKELMNEADRISMGYSYSVIRDAVKLLSGGYKEEMKKEWGRAIVILLMVTCEAVRSNAVCEFIQNVLEDKTDTLHKMNPKVLRELNLWGKISDVAYGKKSFKYEWTDDQNITHTQKIEHMKDVAKIFAVIKAPPSHHQQANHQALTSHHAFFGSAHQNFSNIHPNFGMPSTRSYSTLLPKTVAGTPALDIENTKMLELCGTSSESAYPAVSGVFGRTLAAAALGKRQKLNVEKFKSTKSCGTSVSAYSGMSDVLRITLAAAASGAMQKLNIEKMKLLELCGISSESAYPGVPGVLRRTRAAALVQKLIKIF